MISTDILILGAGPTGLTAAHELARHGLAPRIIDKKPQPVQHSQALAVQVRTLETFDIMGIAEGWLREGFPLRDIHPRVFGKRLPTVHLDGADSRFSAPLSVGQQVTERLLTDALVARGVSVERNLEATALSQDESGVDVTLRSPDGAAHTLRARYVIACEGSHSIARDALAIPFEGDRNPHREMIQADAQLASAYPAGVIHFFVEGERAVLLFPFDNQGHCRILCIIPPSDPPRHDPPTLDDVQAEVRRLADPGATLSTPRWLNRFRTQHRLAAAFRKGRVFIAGDAAHVHVPVGGQGMNYGIQDAFNLAWKLAGVCRKTLAPWVLETYDLERRPVAAALVDATERIFHLVAPPHGAGHLRHSLMPLVASTALALDPVQDAIRNAMAEFNVHYRESPLSETHGGGHLVAGERAPDAPLVLHRTTTRLFDLLRQNGWLLLLCTGTHGHFPEDLAAACIAHARVPAFTLRAELPATDAPADLLDLDHLLHDAFGIKHPTLYLLRPDGYIAFCASLDKHAPDRLAAYLTRLFPAP
jgi:3-(3-hydroxy-phenyl)propionate hydroxylase